MRLDKPGKFHETCLVCTGVIVECAKFEERIWLTMAAKKGSER